MSSDVGTAATSEKKEKLGDPGTGPDLSHLDRFFKVQKQMKALTDHNDKIINAICEANKTLVISALHGEGADRVDLKFSRDLNTSWSLSSLTMYASRAGIYRSSCSRVALTVLPSRYQKPKHAVPPSHVLLSLEKAAEWVALNALADYEFSHAPDYSEEAAGDPEGFKCFFTSTVTIDVLKRSVSLVYETEIVEAVVRRAKATYVA